MLIAGAIDRILLPAVPFAEADSWGYLRPAIVKLAGGDLEHTYGRSFVYPGFLYLVLRTTGDFRAITIAQHVSGLLAGVVALSAWSRLAMLVPAGRASTLAHRVLGLVLVAGIVGPAFFMVSEHSIRPEAIFPLGLALLARLTVDAAIICREGGGWALEWRVAAILFLSAVLYLLRPQWGLAVGVSAMFAPALLFLGHSSLRRATITIAASAGAVFFGLWLPERRLAERDPMVKTFLPETLLFWHMEIVAPILRADLAEARDDDPRRDLVREILGEYDRARSQFQGPMYASLGYVPERLMYGRAGAALASHLDPDGIARFCNGYFMRGVCSSPLAYLWQVTRQLNFVFGPGAQIYPFHWRTSVAEHLGETREIVASVAADLERTAAGRAYAEVLRSTGDGDYRYGFPLLRILWRLALARGLASATYLPCLIAGVGVLALAGTPRWASTRPELAALRPLAALAGTFTLYAFATELTVAGANSLEVGRYIFFQQVMFLFSHLALVLLGVAAVEGAWRAERGTHAPGPAAEGPEGAR